MRDLDQLIQSVTVSDSGKPDRKDQPPMTTEAPDDVSDEPRATSRHWLGLAVLATGLSMIVVDGTIVNVSSSTT